MKYNLLLNKYKHRLILKNGDVGSGNISYRYEGKRKVECIGGNGGNTGSIIIEGNNRYTDYLHLKHSYRSNSGNSGRDNKRNGANGKDLYIDVPFNTSIYDNNMNLLTTITVENSSFKALNPIRGESGNQHTKNNTIRKNNDAIYENTVNLHLSIYKDMTVIPLENTYQYVSNILNKIFDNDTYEYNTFSIPSNRYNIDTVEYKIIDKNDYKNINILLFPEFLIKDNYNNSLNLFRFINSTYLIISHNNIELIDHIYEYIKIEKEVTIFLLLINNQNNYSLKEINISDENIQIKNEYLSFNLNHLYKLINNS